MYKYLKWLELGIFRALFPQPHTAAQDKVVPPGGFFTSGSSSLIQTGRAATNPFKNFLVSFSFPFQDSVCGKKKAAWIFTRTTPLADTDWDDLPIGSLCTFLTVASKVVTNAALHIYTQDGFVNFLTSSRPFVVASAVTARAGSGWHGMRIQSKVPTGQVVTGEQTGLYIETELTGTGQCGNHYGLKIETYVTASTTMSDHYGAGIFTYDDRTGSNQLHVLRLEHNGANVGNAFLGCFAAANKMQYLLESSTTDDTWMSLSTTPTCGTAAGWERVKYGGYVRYRQLYSAIS